MAYFVLGDEAWLQALQHAMDQRDYLTLMFLRSPSISEISTEPRYLELLESVGLDDASIAKLDLPRVDLSSETQSIQ